MLAMLKVRDLVLIEDAVLEFAPGLNVLTGETGAGKSILLDALGLAAGARAGSRSSVRPGAQQGSAVAIFDPPASHPARAVLKQNEIGADGELLLRRTMAADGRTRAFVNDEPVGVGLLRDIGSVLVEIHGQADDRGLFDQGMHRRLLDASGGHQTLVENTAALFRDFQSARANAEAITQAGLSAAADAEYLSEVVAELFALAPQSGEEHLLAADRALLMNASRTVEEISAALELLGAERGAENALASASRRLSRLKDEARAACTGAEQALDQALAQAEEARQELENLLSRLNMDPGELEKKEERLFALRAAARKHGVAVDELPRLLSEAEAKLATIESSDTRLRQAQAEAERARVEFLKGAAKLSEARAKAAKELQSAVEAELTPLKLGHARFRVALEQISADDAGPNGLERVAFELATVEGAPFGPLTKIASGGELARFSLALKVALSEASPPAALVFDEVDRGVGGAVADAVGERLQRLAKTTQVLLVTHAPQVAARAERHFRIVRRRDRTQVQPLSLEERVEEIARMLSGAAVTEEARAAARRLLMEAQAQSPKLRKRA
ncbi:MAG TPA: DNA repair protein RecN [Rhizomicrobium sp.]|nr:DNA repair protein RecN [Rhizomicrobium sp.]